jgi:hypothetical protein
MVGKLTARNDLQVTEVNILDDPLAYEKYKESIPVIEVTDVQVGQLSAPITELVMHSYFIAARRAMSRGIAGGKRRFWPFVRTGNPPK